MLEPIQQIALSKFAPADGTREAIAPGTYTGEFTVRIGYGVTVGEDTDAKPTASVPWRELAVLALAKLNDETRESVITSALAGEASEDMTKAQEKRIKPRIEAIVASLPRIPKKGAVKATINASLITRGPVKSPHGMEFTTERVEV